MRYFGFLDLNKLKNKTLEIKIKPEILPLLKNERGEIDPVKLCRYLRGDEFRNVEEGKQCNGA